MSRAPLRKNQNCVEHMRFNEVDFSELKKLSESAAGHGAKRSEFFVSENYPAAVVFSKSLFNKFRVKRD